MKKIFSISAIIAMALMTAVSCSKTEQENALPLPDESAEVIETLQGLEVTPKSSYLVIGETYQLLAVCSPENVGDIDVTWTSETPEVATVDQSGTVTAVAKGLARITATAEGHSATAIVNVVGERVPATGIVLNKTEISTLVGRFAKVKATLEPENTTDKAEIVWSTSDEKIATVESGVIIAVAMGEATITASQGDLKATCKVTIADKIQLQDRSAAWKMTDTPKWDKNWSGAITGSHVEVALSDCDAEYYVFEVVSAEKGVDIETAANDMFMKVEEKKDAGEDPKSLFKTGETNTQNYSDLGPAIAYVLGFDSEFEFTGEYAKYEFEAKEPDPVHATGIQFLQGSWSAQVITSLELKAGKNTVLQLKFLPEDCTDTGTIELVSENEAIMTVAAYYPQYYSNYYQVTAQSAGTTRLIAKYNDIETALDVTVTGDGAVWTDRSAEWTVSFGDVQQYGNTYFGVTLQSCTSPKHLLFMNSVDEIEGDLLTFMKSQVAQYEDYMQWYARADIPDQTAVWSGDASGEYYAFVVGVTDGNEVDGNYGIFHYVPGSNPGDDPGDNPGDDPVEGKVISLAGQYFPVDFDDYDATPDDVTYEAWVNPSSFSGSNDNIYTVMGTEGIFMLRFENSQLNLVYGGTKRSNSEEYNEKKVTYSTNFTTGEWHHIAATYKRGGDVLLYVDGEQVGSNTAEDHGIELNGVGAQWILPFKFYIGVSSNNRYFRGSLAYLRVWNCVRTASEIKDNMKVAAPADEGYNLVANWHFTEGTGNTIADKAYGYYDLTANSDLTWADGTMPF